MVASGKPGKAGLFAAGMGGGMNLIWIRRRALAIAAALALPVLFPFVGAAAPVFLGPTPYLKQADSPFNADIISGTTFLETFEDHLLNTPGVSATCSPACGVTSVVFGAQIHDSVDADDGVIDGSGLAGDSFFFGGGATGIKFVFDALALGGLPTRAGIVWTDGAGTTLFEAFGPGDVSLGTIGPVSIADGSFNGETAEDRFFGVIDPGGISAIKVSNTGGGIEVDHLQYGRQRPLDRSSSAVCA